MDETRERFLTAIVERLGAERIVELHLFSPIRKGVMETGVAVVAALPDLESEIEAGDAQAVDAAEPEEVVSAQVEYGVDGGSDAPSPYLDATPEPASTPEDASETLVTNATETPAESRHVVFTASYRLTRKGAERGTWAFELAATADAPLATVDTVVRGVMHRSSELTESERLSGDELRTLLAEPAWRTTP